MSTDIEMPLLFNDSAEPIVLKERDLVSKIPLLIRSVESENPNRETTECKVTNPLEIPFPRSAGDFLFQYCRRYVAPDIEKDDPKIEEYKEANEKNLEELKDILEYSNFMECTPFMHCIGFVIAKKLEKLSVEEIADYFGVECNPEGHMFSEEDGWVHPPAEVFQNNPDPHAPTTSQNAAGASQNAPSTSQNNQGNQDNQDGQGPSNS